MHDRWVPGLVGLIITLGGVGCRDAAFRAAAKHDTAAAYRSFLAAHPADENAEAARARLAELDFEAARAAHTLVAYKRFLEAHPDSAQARAAAASLEALRFNAAKDKGTAQALRQFVREHPEGAHRDEADQRLKALELAEVVSLDDPSELARIAAQNPDDPRALEVATRLDAVAWQQATSARALFRYLAQFPAGAHRDEARVKLLSAQLDGLLVSGALDEAQALAAKSPLRASLPEWPARLERAKALTALERSSDERVRRALPSWTRRSFDDVVRSLGAPDAMDRWQAAEELGAFVSVRALDPLLDQLQRSRSALVRQAAFESLQRVLRALPHHVAEYEVATRLEGLEATASDAQLYLVRAALFDLTGQLERASLEYQRAWDPQRPDPVILRRWLTIRQERRQFFASAVAARQLATWVKDLTSQLDAPSATTALAQARELCGAVVNAELAARAISDAKRERVEFPDDLEAFEVRAKDAVALAKAKLRDAELVVLEADARARLCGDRAVTERLAAGEQERVAALEALKATRADASVFELASWRDPSPRVRAVARR